MKVIKFIVLSLLSILLIAMIPLTLLAHSLHATLLKPYALSDYFAKSGFYQALSSTVQSQLGDNGPDQSESTEEQQLFNKSLKESVDAVVTETWLNDKLGGFQNHLWDYLLERARTIPPIDISDLHQSIVTSVQSQFSGENTAGLPQDKMDQIMSELGKKIPSQLDVLEVYHIKSDQLEKVKSGFLAERQAVSSLTLIIVLLVFLGLMISFYFKYSLRWLGYLNAITGLILLAALWFIRRVDLLRIDLFNPAGPFGLLKESMYRIALAVQKEISHILLVETILVLLISAGLIGTSHFPFADRLDAAQRKLFSEKKYRWIRLTVCVIIAGFIGWQGFEIYQACLTTINQ